MRKSKSSYFLDDSLGHLTSNASRSILKRINQELSRQEIPITSEQFSVLVYVWDQNGQPQYGLVEKLYKDKTTMARLVASLESLGLIVRTPGQRDARGKNVFLTEQGRSVVTKVTDLVQDILDSAQRGIDEQELKICKEVLRRFHQNLQ